MPEYFWVVAAPAERRRPALPRPGFIYCAREFLRPPARSPRPPYNSIKPPLVKWSAPRAVRSSSGTHFFPLVFDVGTLGGATVALYERRECELMEFADVQELTALKIRAFKLQSDSGAV